MPVSFMQGGAYQEIDLQGTRPLTDAVCAVIRRREDGDLLLQRRDDRPDVPFRDMYGFFGGSIERDEDPVQALVREIGEELQLALRPEQVRYLLRFDIDLESVGLRPCFRIYYETILPAAELATAVLGEGQGMGYLTEESALAPGRLVPYDGYALWLARNAGRFYVPGADARN